MAASGEWFLLESKETRVTTYDPQGQWGSDAQESREGTAASYTSDAKHLGGTRRSWARLWAETYRLLFP